MSITCWNVRGVEGNGKDAAIKKLIAESKPMMLGLDETKHSRAIDLKAKKWWGNDDYVWFDVQVIEGSRGLIYIWNKGEFETKEVNSRDRWMCVVGELRSQSFKCAITFVYAPNSR